MSSIEEILWNYIDGNCSQAEQTIIAARIAEDEAYRLKYKELLKLNQDFSEMELDEPSMAFTYNVMEDIRAENARAPLKAAINKRIIWGIALFFVVTLLAALFFILTSINWSAQSAPVNLAVNFKMPDINPVKTKIVLQSFVFFDVILALYLLDSYLRKKNIAKQV